MGDECAKVRLRQLTDVLIAARNFAVPRMERRLRDIRDRDEHAPVRGAHTRELLDHLMRALDVLERLEAEHDVELAIGERQAMTIAADGIDSVRADVFERGLRKVE